MEDSNYFADWDISEPDVLETVLVDLDPDCEAVVVDVWIKQTHVWYNRTDIHVNGVTVVAHDGMKDRCLVA